MSKLSFKEKIKNAGGFFKGKTFPVLLASSVIGLGGLLTACNDKNDPNKDVVDPPKPPIVIVDEEATRKEAISTLNKFMASVQSEKNFTAEIEGSLPSAKYTLYVDGDKMKKEDNSAISYVVNETNKLYKIFQTEDLSWHKDEAEEGTKDVDAIISQLIADTNKLSWDKYDKENKTLRVSSDQMLATACLDNGQVVLTAMIDGKSSSCTLSDVGTTLVTLPENVIDDTQQITPPDPELTEAQKQAKIVQNVYKAVEGKLDILGNATIDKIVAMDFENNENTQKYYAYLLVQSTTNNSMLDLIKFPMSSPLTTENMLKGNISTNEFDPSIIFSVNMNTFETSNNETTKSIFEKLKNEELIPKLTYDIIAYNSILGDIDVVLGSAANEVKFYALNKTGIIRQTYSVKLEKNATDDIDKYLINGTYDKTFRQIDTFEHKFSPNVVYSLEGLQYQIEAEQQI